MCYLEYPYNDSVIIIMMFVPFEIVSNQFFVISDDMNFHITNYLVD